MIVQDVDDAVPGMTAYGELELTGEAESRQLWHERLHAASRSLAWSVWWWGIAVLVAAGVGVTVYQFLEHSAEIAARIVAPAI